MENKLREIMKQSYNSPEIDLSDSIWNAIEVRQIKKLKMKSVLYGYTGVVFLFGFIFMSVYLRNQFIYSGFFDYISLMFSSNGLFMVYWKEYLLSLADSLPVATLGALSFLLFGTLFSLRKFVIFYKVKLLKA